MAIWIDSDLCDACGRCVTKCSYAAVILENDTVKITDRCTECGLCIEVCKKKAIFGDTSEQKPVPDFSGYSGVWVFVENTSNGISKVSVEILGKAQKLATVLGEKVTALIFGHNLLSSLTYLKNLGGMDEILVMDNELLKDYDPKSYADLIKKIVEARKPDIFLFGATYLGRSLAPRVAKLVGAGLTADCTDLAIDPEEKILIQTRPAFGGNVLATILSRFSRPQMATVRTGVMAKYKCERTKDPKVEFLMYGIDHPSTKILKIFEEDTFDGGLDKAKIVIGGGRGMGDADGFNILYRLASLLGGKVVGTRVAVENGWISEKNQVGQTGHTITPDLYIACGISGAIQHRAGVLNSRFIVAINKDPNATVFKIANWGIIGSVFDILPEFIRELESKNFPRKTFTNQ